MLSIGLFSLLCMALFAFIGFFWWTRKRLGLPRSGRLGRIAVWAEGVRTSEAEVKTATVGDLVLFVTLYVVGVTLVITMYIGLNQSAEDKYKVESEQAREKLSGLEVRIRDQQRILEELRSSHATPQLVTPTADEQIIGSHVDLTWDYGNHNRTADYVIEVVRISEPRPKPADKSVNAADQTAELGQPCMFAAGDSADQRSQLPSVLAQGGGTYIWRVAFGELVSAPDENTRDCRPDDGKIREWSSYRKFTFYRSRRERIHTTHEVLVGTRFIQNLPFSRKGPDGKPSGFDIDLIKALVEDCLLEDAKGVHYDSQECRRTLESQTNHQVSGHGTTPSGRLNVKFVPIPPGVDWLEELRRRKIDVYIGSVTRAAEREHGDVKFTDGYLTYKSEFLVARSESCSTLRCLADKGSAIGVVEKSTNASLASSLLEDDRLSALKIATYKSFPELENAFEKQEVAAVITDGVMRATMGMVEPKELEIDDYPGWKIYLRNNIGYPKEQFGIAVVGDIESATNQDHGGGRRIVAGLAENLRLAGKLENERDQLRTELNCALSSPSIQGFIRGKYSYYQLGKLGAQAEPVSAKCSE